MLFASCLAKAGFAAEVESFDTLSTQFSQEIRPLLTRFCIGCHSTEELAGELDLEQFAALPEVRRSPQTWQKVTEMLASGEMPPKEARQPSADQRKQLSVWIERYLHAEGHANAGDPGPTVLRRLSNAEYTYTVRDLTGVDLQPAREFPVDGAAGEGFTNTGMALVMSPSLLAKYFDAGKEIASHAVLLPDGLRFSPGTTRRDWTDEILHEIKTFYGQYADGEGRLPLEKYLAATLDEREALIGGTKKLEQVAAERGLNAKYLGQLWTTLTSASPEASPVLDDVRTRWRAAKPGEAARLAGEVAQWQQALTSFGTVGHEKNWMVPRNPVQTSQEFRVKVPAPIDGQDFVTLYLSAGDAGDGGANDFVDWRAPRLVTPGSQDLPLSEVGDFSRKMLARREQVFASVLGSLAASAEAHSAHGPFDAAELARKHGVEADILAGWLDYLGISSTSSFELDRFTSHVDPSGYEFVKGWGLKDTPYFLANSSDQHVRVPGNMKPHGVAAHPGPAIYAAAGWQSPITGNVRIEATVQHAHPECGNGVTWSLELRRGSMRQKLAAGTSAGGSPVVVSPIEALHVHTGDLVSLLIGPRDGNHSCDLTAVDMVIKSAADGREWNLARDCSSDIWAGNPHPDGFGNAGVWHFYTEPVDGSKSRPAIPQGSILARWQLSEKDEERQQLAADVQKLLTSGPPADKNSPDGALYVQLSSLNGPLFDGIKSAIAKSAEAAPTTVETAPAAGPQWGVDPALFGKHPHGSDDDAGNLCVQAPSVVEIRLPAGMMTDSELVVTGVLHKTATEGTAQLQVLTSKPDAQSALRPDMPILVVDGSPTRTRIEKAFDEFRSVFPAALCYPRIVPVDEIVTLTLFHREDDNLRRLMLDERQVARLDRLWVELRHISQDDLIKVDALEQIIEYTTQDRPDLTPGMRALREPFNQQAAEFRQSLIDSEPSHVRALVDLAPTIYRRPLAEQETQQLGDLYAALRQEGLPHEDAIRLMLARMLVSPAFLYRLEQAPEGAQSGPVSDWELASRLSYFLWSSMPDAELRELAAAGKLTDPDALVAQSRRMLTDVRVRRLATEFACQWLHIYEFDTLDEKSERHFPTFTALRGDMYEESIRFFTDAFQHDASVLELFDADHTFLNEALATHYGIPGVTGSGWQRVDGIKKYSRGGILGLSTTLAKQSGASRTSPVLRGNWVTEVLLGEKLPRPPKGVPQLPDDEAATEGLTVRQLVERHSSDAACAKCHVRMDPFGFALEGFDAIGRRREKDLGDRPIDTHARLQDGTEFNGIDGLRTYLLTERRDAIVRQFCRKLLGYALGRGVQLSDGPLLDEMKTQLEKSDYRFSAAVETILRSRQFREIRGKDAQFADNNQP